MPPRTQQRSGAFDEWSPAMAYVLGLFMSDGNIRYPERGHGKAVWAYSSIDQEQIRFVVDFLGFRGKVQRRETLANPIYTVQSHCPRVVNRLVQLGMLPRKSLILPWPAVPAPYLADFVRGYFDGNGTANIRSDNRDAIPRPKYYCFFATGSLEFAQGISQAIADANPGLKAVKPSPVHPKGAPRASWQLNYGGSSAERVAEFMYYPGHPHSLARKRRVYEDWLRLKANAADAFIPPGMVRVRLKDDGGQLLHEWVRHPAVLSHARTSQTVVVDRQRYHVRAIEPAGPRDWTIWVDPEAARGYSCRVLQRVGE